MTDPNKDGASLAGIAGAATALVVGIGGLTLTGTIGRVQRNHGELLIIALALVLVGAACWLKASLPPPSSETKATWRSVGIGATLIGFVIGLTLAVITTKEAERPSIAAELSEDGLTVKGTVEVANLGSDERLSVLIEGLNLNEKSNTFRNTTIYQAYIGPDSDGKVELPIHTRVPPGTYGSVGIKAFTSDELPPCDEYPQPASAAGGELPRAKTRTGCVVLPLQRLALRPQLAATWEKEGQTNSLRLTATAGSAPRLTAIQVVAISATKRLLLHRELAESTGAGRLDRELRLPIPAGTSTVCAVAAFTRLHEKFARPRCPLAARVGDDATIQLRVPD